MEELRIQKKKLSQQIQEEAQEEIQDEVVVEEVVEEEQDKINNYDIQNEWISTVRWG